MVIFANANIITQNPDNPYIEGGAIAVEDGKIAKVGYTNDILKTFERSEYINMEGALIIPGLLNTHMHLYSTFARGFGFGGASPKTFGEILEKIWWKLDLAISSEEEIYYSAVVPIIEGIKAGTTAIIDHHASFGLIDGSLDIIEKAILESGIRGMLAFETSDRWGEEARKKSIKENIRFIKKPKNNDFVNSLFGMHASLTLSNKTLEESASLISGIDTGFHIHVAEGPEDLKDSVNKYGKRVVERLNDFGILGNKSVAVHCIHINENEIEILKNNGTIVVHNPESNMNNAVGAAPILEMDKQGVLVGLGTDGYTPSMFESVKVAYILPKFAYKDPQAGSMLARKMLFDNNKKIFNKFFEKEFGIIKEGAYADFVTLEYYPPTPINGENFFFHLIFGIRENHVKDVVVNGKFILKNRIIEVFDEKEILAKSKEVSKRFWEKIQ